MVQAIRNKEKEVLTEIDKMEIDICILTETKKNSIGNQKVGNYMKIYRGVPKSDGAKWGVAVLVHDNLLKYIESWPKVEQIIILE